MSLVNGNYTQWTPWSTCDDKFDTKRTRTCQGYQHGGTCDGESEEIRKCGEKYDPINYGTCYGGQGKLEAQWLRLRIERSGFEPWPGTLCCMGSGEFHAGGNPAMD